MGKHVTILGAQPVTAAAGEGMSLASARLPISGGWWRRTIRFWNTLAALHDGDLYRQVALDACSDAVTRDVRNWAWAFMRG